MTEFFCRRLLDVMLSVYRLFVIEMLVLPVLYSAPHPLFNSDKTTSFNARKQRINLTNTNKNSFHSGFDCPNKTSPGSNVRVCTVPKQRAGFKKCDAILSMALQNVSVKICIRQNRLLLPNATVVYASENTQTYPIYHEEMSASLKTFFVGSVSVSHTIVPFSGELMSTFVGKAIVFGVTFILQCKSLEKSPSAIFQLHKCHKCQAFCSNPQTPQDFTNLHKDISMMSTPPHNLPESNSYRNFRLRRKQQANRVHELKCSLHLVADHLFFKYIGNNDVVKSQNTMLGVVNKVNSIFRKNFNHQTGLPSVEFVVKHITIFRDEKSKDYKLSGNYMTPDEYLKKFSLLNFDSVCLAIGFTFRNFGDVVGTAFPASTGTGTPGGICYRRMKINSHFVSYNTVIMSFFSLGEISEENLALTLTHELGHSFGARHDETAECLPGEKIGNYIMSSMVNTGGKTNNFLFSPCSMRNIMPIIRRNEKCLRSSNSTPICGNAIPEEGEECDCGKSHHECASRDPCCTPADDVTHKPCTIRRHEGKMCTPKMSSCCNSSCGYVSTESNTICNSLNVCLQRVTCNGQSGYCPPSQPVPAVGNKCPRPSGQYICLGHSCYGDVCHHHHLKHCKCRSKKDHCKLCCQRNTNETCYPVSHFGISYAQRPASHQCAVARHFFVDAAVFHSHSSNTYHTWPLMTFIILVIILVAILCSVSTPYEPVVDNQLNAMKCGKLLAIFSLGEYQSELYRRRVIKLNRIYCTAIDKERENTELGHTEAVARLRALFPYVPMPYLLNVTKLCANENMAVRIILTQGAPMLTFCESLDMLRNAMKQATIRYKI